MNYDHCLVNTDGIPEHEPYLDFNLMNLDGCVRELLELSDGLASWRYKPMIQWSNAEVIDYIRTEISCLENFPQRVNLNRFYSVSGFILHSLKLNDCQLLCDSIQAGELIYRSKECYLRSQDDRSYVCDSTYSPFSTFQEYNFDDSLCGESFLTQFGELQNEYTPLRKPGRPKTKIKPDKNEGKKSEKIWEFLIHLLKDERTCPDLVKWEDPQEGTFKFVQTEKVAQLWGSRKKNTKMTYEKFSRAMRYYYKSKILLPVPGKRLVYKFGPQAKGWRIEIPQW